jgi:hypothetical protein
MCNLVKVLTTHKNRMSAAEGDIGSKHDVEEIPGGRRVTRRVPTLVIQLVQMMTSQQTAKSVDVVVQKAPRVLLVPKAQVVDQS